MSSGNVSMPLWLVLLGAVTEAMSEVDLPNDVAIIAVNRKRPWWHREAQSNMFVMAVVYLIFGASLLLQPDRWTKTPAYTNILRIVPPKFWGIAFSVCGVLLLASVLRFPKRWTPTQLALLLSALMTGSWMAAFIVRWVGSSNTTPETWASFAVFAYLFIRAWLTLEGDHAK